MKKFLLKVLFFTIILPSVLTATTWITTATTAETSKESNGKYQNNQNLSVSLTIPGASRLRVKITGSTERRYDFLYLTTINYSNRYDGNDIEEDFEVDASSINLRFTSDRSKVRSGVKVEIFEVIVPIKANNDSYSTNVNVTLSANALDNDEGSGLIAIDVPTQPTNGTLTGQADGSFIYIPNTDFIGTDFFTYTITDSSSNTSTATVTITVASPYNETLGERPFLLRHQESIFGDVKMIGNTIICNRGSSGTGTCQATPNSNGSTFLSKTSQSYSTLNLPDKAVVKYARMYWQGRNPTNADWTSSDKTAAKTLKIRHENDSYITISADVLDLIDDTSTTWATYSASADITPYLQTHGEGKYYVDPATFYTITGQPDGLGAYGAWVLVVIYEDIDDTTARNITIFDGYRIIDGSNPVDIQVSGFLTPKTGSVDSKAYIFVGEGDRYITGDNLLMKGELFSTSFTSIAPNSNNAFDSRIDVTGVRVPSLTNNNGIDIQKYNIGTLGKDIIKTNEIGATFRFTTGGDVYFPSLVVFSTELYLPKLCYDYAIRQDGVFLPVDRSSYPVAQLDGQISSSPLEITVYLHNEEADISAEGIALKVDINNTVFNHDPQTIYTSNTNGSTLISRETPVQTNPLCDYDKNGNNSYTNNGCTTGHDLRKGLGTLNANEYIYSKFSLTPQNINGITDLNQSLGLSIKYYITAGGNKIEYPDYTLGGANVELCPPTGGYIPTFGLFNVVQSGLQTNNINTQISRKTFNADIIFDSNIASGTNEAPTSDISTTVLVEIIDMDSFGDINASCANPDSRLSTPIFVPINFTSANWQTPIPAQIGNYYNFAVKNAAFRIWYFTDSNGSLIQDWNATTTNSGKTLTGISGLYDSNEYSDSCAAACTTTTSTGCFECIQINYAHPLCSRDNFSVRPESYDIHIVDNNQSVTAIPMQQDLSSIYNYSPNSVSGPIDRIHVAAGYSYKLDVNATGNDGTSSVPGYSRNFNNYNDHNATVLWDSVKGLSVCNETSNIPLSFYMKNGTVIDASIISTNVGEYKLNIIDTAWTEIDWDSSKMTHHTDGFTNGTDCIVNSSSSVLNSSQYGCSITSNHGADASGNIYRDQDLEFHPYKYAVTNTLTVGATDVIPLINKPFIYMADIDQDENISIHLNTVVSPNGFNNSALSNYVDGCYAKPLSLSIAKSATNSTTLTYKLRHHDLNASVIIPALDIDVDITAANINNDMLISLPSTYFQKDGNGTTNMRTNMNYNRLINVAQNPEDINFTSYKVEDNTTLINADLINNKIASTTSSLNNQRIIHYYGRTIATKIRVTCNSNTCQTGSHSSNTNSIQEIASFVVYCDTTANGCSTTTKQDTLLPDGSTTVGDTRWWENRNHDKSTNNIGGTTFTFLTQESDGAIGAVTDTISPSLTNEISTRTLTSPNYASELIIQYRGSLPYNSQLQFNSSNWLLYDPTNTGAANNFIIEWRGDGGWSGKYESKTSTKTNASPETNRRVMW